MKLRAALILAGIAVFSACREKPQVITITETRPLTTRDVKPKLSATSDERFKNAQPSPVLAETPASWLVLPSSQFRLLNYRFGESGLGEVSVALSAGTVLDNANRWLGQFSLEKMDQAALEKLPSFPIVGTTGIWIQAAGEYHDAMGSEPRPGYGLAGVIAQVKGQILTVKMLGPKAEVEAARPVLESYVKSLRLAD